MVTGVAHHQLDRQSLRGTAPPSPLLLFITQVYPPDPAAVGQQIADAAAELARRGHEVIVVTSDRAHDDFRMKFGSRERAKDVEVIRLSGSSFAKRPMSLRILGGLVFTLKAMIVGLRTPHLGAIVVSTAPPMAIIAGLVVAGVRRVPLKYWVMDLNPDQAVALGIRRERDFSVRAMRLIQSLALKRASEVIVLDRFMAQRVRAGGSGPRSVSIIPPWSPHRGAPVMLPSASAYRVRYGVEGKFAVMYSGNHSPSNPISTLLAAAARLQHREDILFLFVGGGVEKSRVAAARLRNVVSFPYVPLADLHQSLSAADLHVVTLGDDMAGIIHPCKIYGALGVGRPVLAIGPEKSHLADVLAERNVGWSCAQGDVDGVEAAILAAASLSASERSAMGRRAAAVVETEFDPDELCGRVSDVLSAGVPPHPPRGSA
jgi:colanic acid biosynthesis glycosyl transferase WcaI